MPILYVDHNGIPAPLSCSYHIADHLTSIRSVVCEVDSTYCPQCFTYQDAYTATKSDCRGRCVRSFCKACPVCFVPLQVAIVESTIGLYQCGYCRYTSFECGVYYDVATSTATTTTTAAKDVAEQLDLVYQKKIQDASPVKLYNSLVDAWKEKEQHCRRIQQVQKSCKDPTAAATLLSNSSSTMKRSSANILGTSSSLTHSSNSIQALEQRCKNSTEQILSSYLSNVLKTANKETLSYDCISSTDIHPAPPSPTTTNISTATINSRVQQGVILPTATSSQIPSLLFPLRIPMLPKITKRCTLELKNGKPGILIKSKMNPLEGDTTSSRTGHGQWWKKVKTCFLLVFLDDNTTIFFHWYLFHYLISLIFHFNKKRIAVLFMMYQGLILSNMDHHRQKLHLIFPFY
jgi:dynactin-4